MDNEYLEVNFNGYCPFCKHEDLSENWHLCSECLENSVNLNSRRPVKWEEKK